MDSTVVELVLFKLKEGVSEAQLLQANEPVVQFVNARPGFLYRSLSVNEQTQQWSDIVYWQTEQDAQASSKAFMESQLCGGFMELIESVVVSHSQVKYMGECQKG